MINIADYGSQDVLCPFYIGEEQNELRCEGGVTESAIQFFKSISQKMQYKKTYCNSFNYKNCLYYIGLMSMYKQNPTETEGTFSEDTLLKYQ